MSPWSCVFFSLLLFTPNTSGVDDSDTSCGPNGSCTCANFIMDCRAVSLHTFPKKIGEDIKAIYLNDNNIGEIAQIPEEANLQTLVLTNNSIKKLNYDAFDNLDNLKTLYLSKNSISTIADDIFEWNPLKLEVLYLDENEIEFIQHFLFYDLEELTDLYLQNNKITFIHPHAFLQLKNLRNLRLDGNSLHTFHHKWIEKLGSNAFTTLRFDNNPWSCDCAMNTSFAWLKKEKRSSWFKGLITDHPIICEMPLKHAKKGLETLSEKEVNGTCDMPKITGISAPATIDSGRDVLLRCVYDKTLFPVPSVAWTAPNKDVYRLNTADNFDGIEVHQDGSLLIRNLSKIDDGEYTCAATNVIGSFTASTKIKVHLIGTKPTVPGAKPINVNTEAPDTNITAVQHKACPHGCQCISRHIDCAGDGTNPKTTIPDGIPEDAITINLASNALTKLRANDFKKFKNLEELRLDDNDISDIDSEAFSTLTGLTTLTLAQNKLTTIEEGTFKTLESLNVLVLDKNRLTKITRNMFEGLTELQWVYIRHNFIKTIDSAAFTQLPKIKFIHMEFNQIGVIYKDAIEPLTSKHVPSIKKIFVDENAFVCNCNMEEIRKLVNDKDFKKKLPDFFGDGVVCKYPPALADKKLVDIDEELVCEEDDSGAATPVNSDNGQGNSVSEKPENYSGLLFGGIAVGVVLTIVITILWRKYGRGLRSCVGMFRRTSGRSYNYSNLNGNDEAERRGLTENTGTEAFV